jgi:hypothetical protein
MDTTIRTIFAAPQRPWGECPQNVRANPSFLGRFHGEQTQKSQ